MFQYERHQNCFVWTNGLIKLEYSHPEIQGYCDYETLLDEHGILYYYYMVKVFRKARKDKWKCVAKRNTYDFPGILSLLDMLRWILMVDVRESGQKLEYGSDGKKVTQYRISENTAGFANDDLYEVVKTMQADDTDSIMYQLFVGTSFDIQGDTNAEGLWLSHLRQSDIQELLLCLEAFVAYSIKLHNKVIDKRNTEDVSKNDVHNDRYYRMDGPYVEAIFVPGDLVSVTAVKKENQVWKKIFSANDTIKEITENALVFASGDSVDVNDIVEVSGEVSKEQLQYGISEIVSDFYNVMSEKDEERFRNMSDDLLYKVYGEAIINRTWMCRSEHAFSKKYKGGPDEVKPYVRQVIKKVRKYVSKKNNC